MRGVDDALRAVLREELPAVLASLETPIAAAHAGHMPDDPASLKIALSEARTDTKFERLMGEIAKVEARMDAKFERVFTEMAGFRSELSSVRLELKDTKDQSRTWFQWTVGTIIAATLTLGLGLGGLLVGVKQIWTAGVQSGQTLQVPPSK